MSASTEEATPSIEEQHTQRLLQQRIKIQKEHERIFHRHMRNQYMKHVNNCFLDENCNVDYVYDIYTTRFTSDTYYQNVRFKQNIQWNGSLYSTMLKFPVNTPDKVLFILDMNNTTNKIVGIGLMRNILAKDQSVNIYSNPSFNNYIYKSTYYISLAEIYDFENNDDISDSDSGSESNKETKAEHNEWSKYIEDEFEAKLFYGKSHSKRGGSFMVFPKKFKQRKHLLFLISLFIAFNPNNFIENVMKKVKF